MSAVINEFVFNHTGSDDHEFVEIFGDPNTDYSNLWILQVEGDSSAPGVIHSAVQVGATDGDGFWVGGFENGLYQNGTSSLLLVENFTGAVNDDLDSDDDGTLESTPWTSVVDSVAVTDGGAGDHTYAQTELASGFDGGSFTVGGASRLPDGTDTDSPSDWVRNDFDLAGIDGFTGSPEEGEALNTPGASNVDAGDVPPPPPPSLLSIPQIQGAGHQSAYAGQTVITTGIVTALDSNGFYLQDPNGDGDVATSDGIFVFTSSAPSVAVGDFAVVTGDVAEFLPGGNATNLTVTQLVASDIVSGASGLDLPEAVILGEGGRLPPTEVVEDDAFGSFDPETDGIDFYESLEGMRVTIPDAVATSSTNRFGETWAVGDEGANAGDFNERGGIILQEDDLNPERIQIQYDSGVLPGFDPAVDTGDGLGAVTGVVGYDFGNYEVKVTEEFTVTDGGVEEETSDLTGSDNQLTVASYNILNVTAAAVDGDAEQIARLAEQIVNNLNGPDVIALQEVQDDSGVADDGTVTADATLQAIVDAIAAAGGPQYEFVDVDPIDNTQGGVPGGNIRVAYLYNPARVDLVDGSVKALDTLDGFGAGNDVRVPLEAQFEFQGETVTLINNHLSSKFGSTPVYGSEQPFINAGDAERTAQTAALNTYVDGLVAGDPEAKVVVLGDMNDFQFSNPIEALKGSGEEQVLFNQIDTLGDEAYTYNFEGNSQVLDHLLVTGALKDRVEFDVVHQNVDFGDAGSTDPDVHNGAASDHEPILARITFGDIQAAPVAEDDLDIEKLATYDSGLGEGAAETVAYDSASQRLFVTNSDDESVDIIDISDPLQPTKVDSIDVSGKGSPTQVAVKDGLVAVAIATDVDPTGFQPMLSGENGFQVQQLFTVGETLTDTSGALNEETEGDYTPVGIMDGIGATELNETTVRVFVNHELSAGLGDPYEVNGLELEGARISYFDIDKATLSIVDGGIAYNTIIDRAGNEVVDVDQLENGADGMSRFCSSVLVEVGQFDGRGLTDAVYLTGEETGSGVGGAAWALDIETGTLYDVPAMGRGAWENVTPVDTGTDDKVAFLLADDTTNAPMYLYVGTKDTAEDAGFLARNGLADGRMYVWVAKDGEADVSDFNTEGKLKGSWEEIDVQNLSQAGNPGYDEYGYKNVETLRAEAVINLGAFQFSRPEDVAINPEDGQQAVLASTGSGGAGTGEDVNGTVYVFDFKFNANGVPKNTPVSILYDGDADPFQQLRSPDNLDWADDGFIYVQEDRSNNAIFGDDAANTNEASILRIDPVTGYVQRVAEIDRSAVPVGQTDTDPNDVGDWESSGILDVSSLFGYEGGSLFLADVQAHSLRGGVIGGNGDLAQGGQLVLLSAPGVDAQVGVNDGDVEREYPAASDGLVAFYDADGNYLTSVDVGNLPDHIAFTPDGTKLLVANEGEALDDSNLNPMGSVSIIDLSNGVNQPTVQTVDFTAFDGLEDQLREEGVRIFPGESASEDLEPEYLAISPDGNQAFVTLQENNAVAIVDIASATIVDIVPLGSKDHSLSGNLLDTTDEDGVLDLDKAPVFGLYMPDQIASFEIGGETFYITANEGDARDEDVRIRDLTLDPEAYPDAAYLQQDEVLGRLQASSIDGDTDGDGDIDQLFVYGARSFSIWNSEGEQVFDSGDQIARVLGEVLTEEQKEELDGRSDNKGSEPEGVTVGVVGDQTYAFVGLERANGVVVFNVSDPTDPKYVEFLQTEGDIGPEGMTFISAEESPNGKALLAVANEVSGTTTLYEIEPEGEGEEPETFTLQILHASDLEGGVEAIGRAANFAAIVDLLEDTHENSITLSAGDNYLSGPFFSASDDQDIFRDQGVFNDFYNELFGLEAPEEFYESLREGGGRVDISIMNAIGFDASALGNHEFDLGTATLADIIAPQYRGNDGVVDDRWIGSQFPYLSANLDFSGDVNLSGLYTSDILPATAFLTGPEQSASSTTTPKIAPATIIEEGGEKIGIVGATTPGLGQISSPGDTTVIGSDDPSDMDSLAAILQPVIDDVIAQGVNKVILVTHLQQIALEKELIGKLSGVDVIIAGGSDTLQADAEDVTRGLNPGDTPDEDYPFQTTNKDGDPAVIVSTDGEYSYVGRLVVEFDENGVLILDEGEATDEDVSGAFATTDAQVAELYGNEDPFAEGSKGDLVQDLTDAVEAIVTEKDSNILGKSDVFLEGRRDEVRTEETNFGNLSADANLAQAQSCDDTVMVSIKNGGGIRSAIGTVEEVPPGSGIYVELPPQDNPTSGKQAGEVSQLDVENALKFNNGLTLITLTAAQLLAVLEHGVAATEPGATPGQFPQVGGVAFSFDPTQPSGDRIQSAAILDDDGNPVMTLVENGELAVDAGAPIRVVTLDFLAGGGDSYPFADFVAADPDFADVVQLKDVLTDAGASDFAAPGSEQDAMAEYLLANYNTTAFGEEDTTPADDTRIQNLTERSDTVLEGVSNGDDPVNEVGTKGADLLEGGLGDDTLDGGRGDDTLDGGDGDDLIDGERDDDLIAGGDGDDTIAGGRGDDTIDAGDGDDVVEAGRDDDVVDAGDGDDDIDGGRGDDLLTGGAGDDELLGDRGDDTIDGGADDDYIDGGRQDDLLTGGEGDDRIIGGRGDDTLDGGEGDDTLTGDRGDDLFVFDGGDGIDVITDFEPGGDLIQLNGFSIADFGELMDAAVDDGADVVITLDVVAGDELHLVGVNKADLDDDDFMFNVA